MRLHLPEPLKAQIEAQARAAFPRECCGLVEGVWRGNEARALALHPSPNLAPDPDRFEIAPTVQFQALKIARAAGHAVIGCYHSHPNGEVLPSARDAAGAGEENFLWLIAALAARDAPMVLAGFAYFSAGFTEIGLVTGADLVTSSTKQEKRPSQ
jgi:proteasome lid subunit RPN8/RPN11